MNFEYIGAGLSVVSIITASLPFVRDLTTTLQKDAQVFLKEFSDYSDNIAPNETKTKCLQRSFKFLTKASIDIKNIKMIVLSKEYTDIVKYCRKEYRHLENLCSNPINKKTLLDIKNIKSTKTKQLLGSILSLCTAILISVLMITTEKYSHYIYLDTKTKEALFVASLFVTQMTILRLAYKKATRMQLECCYMLCVLEWIMNENDRNKEIKKADNIAVINTLISTK
ncbi:hypothetical protein [Cobetia sp. 5-25-4-2]|uniref:hypothetical protein n=1 Tax=Cobetia sp. 5-25-4-2 TaxID=2737459 RepID=UPI0015969371|nr:hypothetical protein [Cobetia sp. 5-25-4-2]